MLLSRSAFVACGPRPGARGKKHDLFFYACLCERAVEDKARGPGSGWATESCRERRLGPKPRAPAARGRKPRLQPAARSPSALRALRAPAAPEGGAQAAPRPRPAPAACPPSQWLREATEARESPQGTGLPGLGARSRPGPESSAAADHWTSEPGRPAS